jgi:predicted pyridoxine 5'-phosphate oxidase superfamily flavin-nucleotide-binding protein
MDVFHAGEIEAQRRAGERPVAERIGRMIGARIPEEAADFVAGQAWAVIAAGDAHGRLWASALLGQPGFLRAAEDGAALVVERALRADDADPLRHLTAGAVIGVLLIEPATRRRLRVNGTLATAGPDGSMRIAVREAFPNCPRHITPRALRLRQAPGTAELRSSCGEALDAEAMRMIGSADTIFLATRHATRGVDASHRGGAAGFVTCDNERSIGFIDHRGNSMFNSIGNLLVDPTIAVLVPDFTGGSLLHVTGRAEVIWPGPDRPARQVRITVDGWRRSHQASTWQMVADAPE